MKKQINFKDFLIKFFEPAIKNKTLLSKALFPIISGSIINIISVYLLKEITNKLVD
jgi:hypothetical protein